MTMLMSIDNVAQQPDSAGRNDVISLIELNEPDKRMYAKQCCSTDLKAWRV